jgi:hypothetical protein
MARWDEGRLVVHPCHPLPRVFHPTIDCLGERCLGGQIFRAFRKESVFLFYPNPHTRRQDRLTYHQESCNGRVEVEIMQEALRVYNTVTDSSYRLIYYWGVSNSFFPSLLYKNYQHSWQLLTGLLG